MAETGKEYRAKNGTQRQTTLVIHQPEFLPWLGFFERLINCDVFVILDSVQFEKGGFTNRNRIKTPKGWEWLTVPVKRSISLPRIDEIQIDNSTDWRGVHWKTLSMNYGKALHFKEYAGFFEDVYKRDWMYLSELNIFLIRNLMRMLGLEVPVVESSSMALKGARTELLIGICKETGASTYLSGVGAKSYMEVKDFEDEGIEVLFQEFQHPGYPQRFARAGFQSHMSVIDLLFNCGEKSFGIIRDSKG